MSNPRPTPATPQYGGASKFGMRRGGLSKYWMSAIIGSAVGLAVMFVGLFSQTPILALGGLGFAVVLCMSLMALYFKLRYLVMILAVAAVFAGVFVGALYAVIYYVI